MADIAIKKRGPKPPKTPKIGRANCGGGGDIDEVSASRIWKEHCLKVEAIIPEPGDFSFNPNTLHYMCKPPTEFYPSMHVSEEELAAYKLYLEKYSMIKEIDKTPPEKYELPQTISQEYGLIGTPLVPKNSLFNYDNNSCEITRYAAHYCSLMHTTPFSKKEPIATLMPPGNNSKATSTSKSKYDALLKAPAQAQAEIIITPAGATLPPVNSLSGLTDLANAADLAPVADSALQPVAPTAAPTS